METLGTSSLSPVGAGMPSAWHVLVSPLQAVVSFFAPWRESLPADKNHQAPRNMPGMSHGVIVHRGLLAANSQQFHPRQRNPQEICPPATVRVLRVVDASCSSHSAGRMRISGRFSDVCAELDRLSQQEAA